MVHVIINIWTPQYNKYCDCRQFSYVDYDNKNPPYKDITQLGVILKREYPGVVEDRDENGALIRKRAALD